MEEWDRAFLLQNSDDRQPPGTKPAAGGREASEARRGGSGATSGRGQQPGAGTAAESQEDGGPPGRGRRGKGTAEGHDGVAGSPGRGEEGAAATADPNAATDRKDRRVAHRTAQTMTTAAVQVAETERHDEVEARRRARGDDIGTGARAPSRGG